MSAQIVEPNYFDTMGLRPVHGRGFEAAETSPVAVISNGVWLSEFSGDPSVLGRAITVNGLPFTVVGVAPVELAGLYGGTQGLLRVDVWLPAAFEQSVRLGDARQERRGSRGYDIVGRLREGVGIDEAQARLAVVGRRLHQSYPESWTRLSGQPRALTIRAANEARLPSFAFGPLAVLSGLVGTFLLIVCANISGLLLADRQGRSATTCRKRSASLVRRTGSRPRASLGSGDCSDTRSRCLARVIRRRGCPTLGGGRRVFPFRGPAPGRVSSPSAGKRRRPAAAARARARRLPAEPAPASGPRRSRNCTAATLGFAGAVLRRPGRDVHRHGARGRGRDRRGDSSRCSPAAPTRYRSRRRGP